jgi:alpha-tubulin suppressor-like RCC1 family protein
MKFSNISIGSNYCYCLDQTTNEAYSWGMGYNYVCGTREEENECLPKKVSPVMFHKLPVKQIGCGSQHVVVLTTTKAE